MEIHDPAVFLDYFNKVHRRTMRVVRCIPPDKVDWTFREGKFTVGDVARHIAATNRYLFAETLSGRPCRYLGCGRELASSYEEILSFMEKMHEETRQIVSQLPDLNGQCTTPDGGSLTVWKWMRAMVEHEIHHRGQIYIYLALLGAPSPPLYGLTSEQVIERSVRA